MIWVVKGSRHRNDRAHLDSEADLLYLSVLFLLQMSRVLVGALLVCLQLVALVAAKDKLYDLSDSKLLLDNEKDIWFDSLTVSAPPVCLSPSVLALIAKVSFVMCTQERELQEKWSADDGLSIAQKIDALRQFSGVLTVDVRLVGFDGSGNMELSLTEQELLKYFDAAGNVDEARTHVIHTKVCC
jgi:hypothetical protein